MTLDDIDDRCDECGALIWDGRCRACGHQRPTPATNARPTEGDNLPGITGY